MPPCTAFPQGPEVSEPPVVGGIQVIQQSQFRIAAVRQAFFTSVMVMRR